MRNTMRHVVIIATLFGVMPTASYAIDQRMYESIHGDLPVIPSGGTSLQQRVENGTSDPETRSIPLDKPVTMTDVTPTHKKQVPTAERKSSTDDSNDDLATTPAPLGVNAKADIGLGVLSRTPGATGR